MEREVIPAKLDVIFKKLFEENTDLLEDFVSGILEIPKDSIQIPYSNSTLKMYTKSFAKIHICKIYGSAFVHFLRGIAVS